MIFEQIQEKHFYVFFFFLRTGFSAAFSTGFSTGFFTGFASAEAREESRLLFPLPRFPAVFLAAGFEVTEGLLGAEDFLYKKIVENAGSVSSTQQGRPCIEACLV